MPGYYNPAYGITVTVAPTSNFYVSAGAYDGNLARGIQTGLNVTPEFNGYYFAIGEVGYSWRLGPHGMPGTVAVGGWGQTGELSADGVTENGAAGSTPSEASGSGSAIPASTTAGSRASSSSASTTPRR